MITYRFPIIFGVLVALASPAYAAEALPDPTTSREFSAKLNVCNLCHGLNGVPRSPNIPIIWGQQENYLLKQLHDFESRDRDVEVMTWMAETLTPAEVQAAAAYFAKQNWPARAATASTAPPPNGIAVCGVCHQQNFTGTLRVEGMTAPRLAGQSYEYLVETMRQYAEGERTNNADMAQILKAIPAAQREAIARYISGL